MYVPGFKLDGILNSFMKLVCVSTAIVSSSDNIISLEESLIVYSIFTSTLSRRPKLNNCIFVINFSPGTILESKLSISALTSNKDFLEETSSATNSSFSTLSAFITIFPKYKSGFISSPTINSISTLLDSPAFKSKSVSVIRTNLSILKLSSLIFLVVSPMFFIKRFFFVFVPCFNDTVNLSGVISSTDFSITAEPPPPPPPPPPEGGALPALSTPENRSIRNCMPADKILNNEVILLVILLISICCTTFTIYLVIPVDNL